MSGLPGHNSQPHSRLPHSSLGMDGCVTSRLNVALFQKLCETLVCFAYFLNSCPGVADVRSTGAGIECLHCTGGTVIDSSIELLNILPVKFTETRDSIQNEPFFGTTISSRV